MDDKTNLIKPILVISIIILACAVVILGLQIFQTVKINSLSEWVQAITSEEQKSQTKGQEFLSEYLQIIKQSTTQSSTSTQQTVPLTKPGANAGGLIPLTATQESCLKTCTGSGKTIQVCASAAECNLPAK